MEILNITDVNKTINLNNNSNDNNENNNNEINNNSIENNNNQKNIDKNISKSNENNLFNSNTQFLQKITIENFPSKDDLLYITESFFKNKNYFTKIF